MRIINNIVIDNSSGFTMEYIASPFDEKLKQIFSAVAFLGKVRVGNSYTIMAYGSAVATGAELVGVSILPDAKIMESKSIITVKELFIGQIGEESYNLLPRMTEEEFYAIPE